MKALGSVKLTLVLIAATTLFLLYSRFNEEPVSGTIIAIPFFMLSLNLLAALFYNKRLRTQTGLLIFHLALAVMAALAGGGQLSAFSGIVELTEGMEFNVSHVTASPGPLYQDSLDTVKFLQGPFTIRYEAGMSRRETVSTIFIPGPDDQWTTRRIGDDHPLILDGYRFYTTSNKGFAPILSYTDSTGQSSVGSIHMPGYPLNDETQLNDWTTPDGTTTVALWLNIPQPVYTETASWNFTLPENASLTVTVGETRTTLKPGDSMPLADGTLRFEEIRTWMGYGITRDSTILWILVTTVIAIFGLGWHATLKMVRSPWNSTETNNASPPIC